MSTTVELKTISQYDAKEMFAYLISQKLNSNITLDPNTFVNNLLFSIINNNNLAMTVTQEKNLKTLDLSLFRKDSINFVLTSSTDKEWERTKAELLPTEVFVMKKGWKTSEEFGFNLEKIDDYMISDTESSVLFIPKYSMFLVNKGDFNTLVNFSFNNMPFLIKLIRKTNPEIIINQQSNIFIETEYYKEFSKIKKEIELNRNISNFKSSRLKNNTENRIKTLIEYINEKTNQINEYRKQIEMEEYKLLFGFVDHTESLKHLLLSDKRIKSLSFEQSGKVIKIVTEELKLVHYDEMKLKILYEKGYNDASKDFKTALLEVLNGNASIYVGSYTITLDSRNSDRLVYSFQKNSKYGNSHWEGYSCLGNFSNSFGTAVREDRPDTLLLMILEYLQSMNFADAGASRMPQLSYILNNEGKKIYG